MATYGGPGKNFFKLPGANLNNNYYVIVDADKGVTEVYRQGGTLQGDISIGTYNPTTSKFTENKTNITSIEAGAIINPNNAALNQIRNSAVQTAVNGGLSQAEAQKLIVPNTAPAAPQQPGQGGTPPPAPVLPSPGIGNPVELPEPITISSGPIRYPKNIKDEQDRIKFQAVEIQPRTGTGAAGSLQFSFGEPIYKVLGDGPVIMAIQSPISDQNSVDWGPDSVNAIDSALFNLSKGFIGGQGKEPTGTDLGFDLYKIAKDNQGRILNYIAGQAAGINNVLSRTDGVVLNPNLELLFQGPQLRPFTFTFKMSARSQPEADDIKKIIKYFKYHMAVRKDERDLFLKAPHVFTIQYEKGVDKIHPGINLISPSSDKKACALTNCSVDYTPLGSYMTYEDGTMVAYTLNLQFQEITPIYNTDYETEPGKSHPIGY